MPEGGGSGPPDKPGKYHTYPYNNQIQLDAALADAEAKGYAWRGQDGKFLTMYEKEK